MNPIPKKRLLVLGFDAMDVELVRSWSAAGYLPTFRRLFENSAWAQYSEPPEYLNGVPWTNINTGLGPLQNDFYSLAKFCPDSYRLRQAKADDVKGDPFWKWFAQSERRIVVADVPYSIPRSDYGGKQYCGWGQHDVAWSQTSVPRGLFHDLSTRFGNHPLPYCHNYSTATDSLLHLRSGLLTGIERRTALFKSLIGEHDWELFYGVYSEPHCAGHLMWHLEDASHPQYNPEQAAVAGHALREVYAGIDRALGELIGCVDAGTTCVIFFSHGMGPNYHAEHLFAQFVERFNLWWRGESPKSLSQNGRRGPWDSLWRGSVGRIPAAWRASVKHQLPLSFRNWITIKREQNPSRWSRMPAFSIPRDGYSSLRVNLAGRESEGRVGTGDEYTRYLDAFTEALSQLVNAENGERVVEQMFRADQRINPMKLGSGPDLVVWWSKRRPIRAIHSGTLGTIAGEFTDLRSGEHVMRGMLLVSQLHAKRGRHTIPGMKGVDIPVTLCELGGVQPRIALEGTSRAGEFLTH
jgi:predicted AlkP superfamily phosphohydrolase/phosphomutase